MSDAVYRARKCKVGALEIRCPTGDALGMSFIQGPIKCHLCAFAKKMCTYAVITCDAW